MKEWLTNMQPPKFLRYSFYIIYSWYRNFKSESADAHITATIILAGTYFFFLLGIVFLLLGGKRVSEMSAYSLIFPIALLLIITFYFLFIYKKKWTNYINEFIHITKKDRLKGSIYIGIYLIASILFLLIIIFTI